MNPSSYNSSDQSPFTMEDEHLLSYLNELYQPENTIPGFTSPPRQEENNSVSLDTPPPPSPPPHYDSSLVKFEAESLPTTFSIEEQALNIDFLLQKEDTEPSLPAVPSLIHYSLNPYPGPYNFTVTIPPLTELGVKPKWCYSPTVDKLYAAKLVTFPINIKMEKFIPDASIIICPIYSTPSAINLPVKRCYLCELSDTLVETKHQIIQVEGSSCKYFVKDNRCMSVIRMPMPAPGDSSSQLLVKMACNTSCVGGPNRRPFSIMLSVIFRNEEVGRQVIHTKCCESPIRDMRRDEANLRKPPTITQLQAKDTEPGENATPNKRLKTEVSIKVRKQKKIKMDLDAEPLTPLFVPSRFHKKVKSYLNSLYMKEQYKRLNGQLKKFYPSETESD